MEEEEEQTPILPTVTIEDAQNALQQLKIFALVNSVQSERLIDCTVELSSVYSKLFTKLKKQKQCKIYDFFKSK